MSFQWVPAGMRPDTLYGAEMYVRFEKTGAKKVSYKVDYKTGRSIITCPDRTILMQRGFIGPTSKRPVNENYDIFMILDPYRKGGISEKYFEMMLMSAHSVSRNENKTREDYYHSSVKIMADSGGAQLRFGTESFIDPKRVGKFFSDVADLGVTLDVPPRPVDIQYKNGYKALAEVQKRNTDIILSSMDRQIPILNVTHGYNLDSTRRWGNYVIDSRLDSGWGIGMDPETAICCIQNALIGAFELPFGNKHIHMFGWGSLLIIPVLAWLGRYVDLVTADSSSNVFSAMRSRIGSFFIENDYIRNTPIGSEKRGYSNPNTPIPCSCPVCTAIGWLDVYGLPQEARVTFPLSWHNMFTLQAYSKYWDYFSKTCTIDECKKHIKRMFSKQKAHLKEILKYIDYIECARTRGLDKARLDFNIHTEEKWGAEKSKIDPIFADKTENKREATFMNLQHRNSILIESLPFYMSREEREKMGVELLEDDPIEVKLDWKPKTKKGKKVRKVVSPKNRRTFEDS